MAQITIDVDPRTGKLGVTCPFWANDAIVALEPKSWSKAQRRWLVPVSRATVTFIETMLKQGLAEATAGAKKAMLGTSKPKSSAGGFPAWYKFKTTPRKHQAIALRKYGVRALALFIIMRGGKTKIVIDMASALFIEGKIDSLLIVTKLSTRKTWVNEFADHCPIDYDIFLPDTDHKTQFYRWAIKSDTKQLKVCVVGTESLSAGGMGEMAMRFMGDRKVMMAVDESSYISNHKAERSQRCVDLGKQAEYKLALTGTPVDEGPMNLFMQFEFLDTNIIGIGDFYAFRNRYAVMGGYLKELRPGVKKPTQIVGYQNIEELTKLIAPYTIEVGEDQLDLPPKVYERRHVTMLGPQRKLYDQIRKERAYTFKGQEVVLKNILELELRLHQLCGGHTATRVKDDRGRDKSVHHQVMPAARNPKILELLDIIGEVGNKQGVVWCAYRAEIDEVLEVFAEKGITAAAIHGGIEENDRELNRVAFQEGRVRWLVCNAATGSMGLNMSAASLEVFYSNTNKMIDRTQAEMRPQAIGKKGSLLIVDIIVEDSVDELRMLAIENKQNLADYIKARLRECIAAITGDGEQ